MEMGDIDLQVNTYLRSEEYDQAERFLLEQYEQIKRRGDSIAFHHILSSLAMFYRLPFKRSLTQAELYYREMEARFPGRESDLELASFYFHRLLDFVKTVSRVDAMGKLENQDKKDIKFYYSALTLKGHALLHLNRVKEATQVLWELARVIEVFPKQVPYGDEFNFLNEMTQRKIEPKLCNELANMVVARIRDQEFKEKYLSLLKQLNKGA